MPEQNKPKSEKDSQLQQWLNRKTERKKAQGISRLPAGTQAPLSFGQQRLWFLQQLYPENPFYHYTEGYRLLGRLQTDTLIESFKQIAQRHDALRTTFEVKNGQPILRINTDLNLDLTTFNLQHLSGEAQDKETEKIARAEASRPFDLQKGPLVRISLLHLHDEALFLVLTLHHIITDKWSMRVLREEWGKAYQRKDAFAMPEIHYADYAWWQRNQPVDPKHLGYWRKKLDGSLPQLTLPTDHKRSGRPSFKGAFHEQVFSPQLSQQLQKLSKETNTTMFVLLLAIYKVLLKHYSGQADILVGAPVTNRDQTALEKLIGFFNETTVLRTDLSGNPSFLDLVGQVRSTVLEAFSHKNVPFEALVQALKPERSMSVNPLFQVMFLYHRVPPNPDFGPDLYLEYKPLDIGVSKFDLTLYISEDNEKISATFEYASDLFEHDTIDRMQGHLRTLIEGIVENPKQRIADLPLLTAGEVQQILFKWNDTATPIAEAACIHQLIEAQALKNPDHISVVFEGQSLTYKDLNNRANAIANQLLNMKVSPGSLVGLCTDRSHEMIIGTLGILKAGAAYVPLDPEYPVERIHYMVQDASMPVILTQAHLADLFAETEVALITINSALNIPQTDSSAFPVVTGANLAYVIYTSGSTGQPKGVQVSHQNLLHSTTARFLHYPNQPGVFLLLSSFGFDSSVAGIFWSLCGGGKLVLAEHRIEQDLDHLAELIEVQNVTHTLLLPSLYMLLLQHVPTKKLASLNTVIVAGEACSSAVCRQHFEILPEVELYNEYGPSEATVWSTVHKIQPEDASGPVPIGRPIANTQHYILDTNLQPVPVGIAGELFIGGPGVTHGYLNRPELTATRFVSNPFSNNPRDRLYKTGDLVRYRSNGVIEFLGRADNQVKIRGYRIEPEEIQEVLQGHSGVREAVVLVEKKVAETIPEEMATKDIKQLTEILNSLDPQVAEDLLQSVENIDHLLKLNYDQ